MVWFCSALNTVFQRRKSRFWKKIYACLAVCFGHVNRPGTSGGTIVEKSGFGNVRMCRYMAKIAIRGQSCVWVLRYDNKKNQKKNWM